MAEKDWIALVKEFLIKQSSGIQNSIFYAEDVGGVKYEFVLELPDDIPIKTGISGSEIVDVNKTLDDTIVNVQRVFPDGEVIVDYSFNAKGKGGDVQALDKFNKILKEGKGMEGVLLEYYDTFPVETTLPTTVENDITIPNTLESIDTPTNVVDDLAKQNELINNFVNSIKTEGNLEFYVKHSGTKVPASSIQYNPRIGKGSQIPGFYTEPLGIRDIKVMGGSGGTNAISNYYKVQVNSNNLLISAGGGKVTGLKSPISTVGNANLGNEIEKINWKIFEQETGLSWENDFNGKGLFSVENGQKYLGSDSQGFIRRLRGMGLTDDEISSALRKSGIEGFVSGPTNAQYEVVLLDPNDELGIGKNINVQDATETDFVNNQSKVNQIDELIIDTPTNVVDDVTPASVVDESVEYIDNLNIDNAIKKEVKDKIIKVTGQSSGAIPIPGVGQAIDLWETAVLVVGAAALAAGEIDELPKVIYNYGLDLYESILLGYNIPVQPEKRKEYNPNLERISSGLTWIDKLQPTSYLINPAIEKIQELDEEFEGESTASGYAYMTPVQSTPEKDNINSIMTNLMSNISNAQKSYPITADEIGTFARNPINVVPEDTKDKPVKVEYDSKEKQNLHDIYAELYKNLSNASARIQ